jgi:hypothetical protein
VPNATAKAAEIRQKQSDASKRATVDMLLGKARATTEFSIYLVDESGDQQEVTLKYQAIGMQEYDKLVSKHPPTPEQRVDGASFNIDTFAPALISAVCVEPELTPAQAKQIWSSPDWSRGDVMVLFRNAVELNNRGLDVPFSANG